MQIIGSITSVLGFFILVFQVYDKYIARAKVSFSSCSFIRIDGSGLVKGFQASIINKHESPITINSISMYNSKTKQRYNVVIPIDHFPQQPPIKLNRGDKYDASIAEITINKASENSCVNDLVIIFGDTLNREYKAKFRTFKTK